MSNWQNYLTDNHNRFQDELLDLLRIPSISAQEAHIPDVHFAADWVAHRLEAAGQENVRHIPTGKHKAIYADWLHASGKPTLLIYGHFDVQPADPLDEWTTPPFEPRIEDGRIYARGASDMKGGLIQAITAVEALVRTTGGLPVNIKWLLEGQEEIGSPDLPIVVEANKELLVNDYVINIDAGQYSDDQPLILLGGRGMSVMELHVKGPAADLHSGLYGGAVQNPIHALVQLLNSLHSPDGIVAVSEFYDKVARASEEELARVPPQDDKLFAEVAGVSALFGESGYTTYERTTMRPTLEVNGIWGGYQGDGVKTVLPSSAHAKITCRLVAGQNPREIAELVRTHINSNVPVGVTAELVIGGVEALPFSSTMDSPGNVIAADVLTKIYGRQPYYLRSGGSIPILATIERILGRQAVAFGFAQDDEKAHSPNEFLRQSSFQKGPQAYCLLFEAFGKEAHPSSLSSTET